MKQIYSSMVMLVVSVFFFAGAGTISAQVVINDVSTGEVVATEAVIYFSVEGVASADSTPYVDYGLSSSLGSRNDWGTISNASADGYDFAATLRNLEPGKTYFYRSKVTVGEETYSGQLYTFTTPRENEETVTISKPAVTSVSDVSAKISFTVRGRESSNPSLCFSTVHGSVYDNCVSLIVSNQREAYFETSHTLSGLNDNTTYFYQLVLDKGLAREVKSPIYSFATLPGANEQLLLVTFAEARDITKTSAKIYWKASMGSQGEYRFSTNPNELPSLSWSQAGVSNGVTNFYDSVVTLNRLKENTTYYIELRKTAQNGSRQVYGQSKLMVFSTAGTTTNSIDFVLTHLNSTPENIVFSPYANVGLKGTFRYRGIEPFSGSVWVSWHINNKLIKQSALDYGGSPLKSGESRNVTLDSDVTGNPLSPHAAPGLYQVKLVIDSRNEFNESDESNNTLQYVVQVGKGSVTLLAPNDETKISSGKKYRILWDLQGQFNGDEAVSLSVIRGSQERSINNFETTKASHKYFDWSIPNDLTYADDYFIKITVCDLDQAQHACAAVSTDVSDSFSIIAPPVVERSPENMSEQERAYRDRVARLNYLRTEKEQQVLDEERDRFTSTDASLVSRLQGRILLQVQNSGEAWYVDPQTKKKFYLKDGESAYAAMNAFGLGITNANLEKIPIGLDLPFSDTDTDGDGISDRFEEAFGTNRLAHDTDGDGYRDDVEIRNGYDPRTSGKLPHDQQLVNQLKGKIVLQVENAGRAWYINPVDGKRYYLKDGDTAYQIMRSLSLGVTNGDLRKIPVGSL